MTREAIPQSEELAEVVSADKGSLSDAYAGSASNKLLLFFCFGWMNWSTALTPSLIEVLLTVDFFYAMPASLFTCGCNFPFN